MSDHAMRSSPRVAARAVHNPTAIPSTAMYTQFSVNAFSDAPPTPVAARTPSKTTPAPISAIAQARHGRETTPSCTAPILDIR